MQREDILKQAVQSITVAWHAEQLDALPHLFAGYATAVIQTAAVARMIQHVKPVLVQAGGHYSSSLIRVQLAPDSMPVPSVKLVTRPAISLTEAPNARKIHDICSSIQVAQDRMLHNILCRAAARVINASEIQGWVQSLLSRTASSYTALVGSAVDHSFAFDIAKDVLRDVPDGEHKILLDNQMLVGSDRAAGAYSATPVRVESIDPEKPEDAVKAVFDVERAEDDPMRRRLEFTLVTDFALAIHRPETFFFVEGAPRG